MFTEAAAGRGNTPKGVITSVLSDVRSASQLTVPIVNLESSVYVIRYGSIQNDLDKGSVFMNSFEIKMLTFSFTKKNNNLRVPHFLKA